MWVHCTGWQGAPKHAPPQRCNGSKTVRHCPIFFMFVRSLQFLDHNIMYAVTDRYNGQQMLSPNLYNNIVVLCGGLLITREYNEVFMNRGYFPNTSEFSTLLNGTLVQSFTMSRYTRWVHDSFKHILVDSCDGYLQTNDRGIDKGRSKFIAQVAADIADSAGEGDVALPNDLEKVWKCLLFNFA